MHQSCLWREKGTLYIQLLFIRKSISSIFPEGTDLLKPLFDFERCLAEVLLNQPEKMVSMDEALKKIEERAKKNKKPQPTSSAVSPLSSPSRQSEKRKEIGPSEGHHSSKREKGEERDHRCGHQAYIC